MANVRKPLQISGDTYELLRAACSLKGWSLRVGADRLITHGAVNDPELAPLCPRREPQQASESHASVPGSP